MEIDNCRIYFQTEEGELFPIDRVQPLSNISTSSIDTERSYPSDFTMELEGGFSSTVDRYFKEEKDGFIEIDRKEYLNCMKMAKERK